MRLLFAAILHAAVRRDLATVAQLLALFPILGLAFFTAKPPGDLGHLFAANGFVKLPGGLIIQWGSFALAVSSSTVVTWPLAFPNNFFAAATVLKVNSNSAATCFLASATLTQGTFTNPNAANAGDSYYVAVGN